MAPKRARDIVMAERVGKVLDQVEMTADLPGDMEAMGKEAKGLALVETETAVHLTVARAAMERVVKDLGLAESTVVKVLGLGARMAVKVLDLAERMDLEVAREAMGREAKDLGLAESTVGLPGVTEAMEKEGK